MPQGLVHLGEARGNDHMHSRLSLEPCRGVSRRKLLLRTAAGAAGGLLAGPAAVFAQQCRPTAPDVLGPFYRGGAPARAKLADVDEAGDVLVLSGTVYAPDCRTPLPGALLDVWQADSKGLYDIGKPANLTERERFHLRGRLLTDAQGRYEIETIVPGSYPIPPGLPGLEQFAGRMRPAHIHFLVMHPMFGPLTTQLYFKGDPHLGEDPWAKPSLAIDLVSKAAGGITRRQGTFDIVLAAP
jgi:catechol 1,2-dioxygenase